MKKALKIFLLLLFILFIIGVIAYYLSGGYKRILFREPRKPALEIPVTYNIGWWSNQEELFIDSLHIEIEESALSLFNAKSLVSYKISGNIKCERGWLPKIEEVHISERLNNDTTLNYERIIELTPVVKTISSEKDNGKINFELKNEHIITSSHWGVNRIKFVCKDKEQIIELTQRK